MSDLLIKQSPPVRERKKSTSKWMRIFDELRNAPETWFRVDTPLARQTAAQQASDIRNAHTRNADHRLRGILDKERYDADWFEDTEGEFGEPGKCYVYVRKVS